ncbi:transposase [Kitasatospora sp. NPDC056138]|uniref:transposase n=1 Tax=Kitasatospora sp. NPDC056138 TaxID=3345724 RepID=UPI0035DEA9B9
MRVPDKTNEITCFAALLAPFDLTGVTVTADALHTQRAHARFLADEKQAHYLLVIKANQPEPHRHRGRRRRGTDPHRRCVRRMKPRTP